MERWCEDAWHPIDHLDPLFGPRGHEVPVATTASAIDLATVEPHPEDFEKFVRAFALQVHGARPAFRYGVGGQHQRVST